MWGNEKEEGEGGGGGIISGVLFFSALLSVASFPFWLPYYRVRYILDRMAGRSSCLTKKGGVVEWFKILNLKSGGFFLILPLHEFVLGSTEINSLMAVLCQKANSSAPITDGISLKKIDTFMYIKIRMGL